MGFTASWEVMIGDKSIVRSPFAGYSCRDACWYNLHRSLRSWYARQRDTIDPFDGSKRDHNEWKRWTQLIAPEMRITAIASFQSPDTARWREQIDQINARLIEKLVNKFPSITFSADEVVESKNMFGGGSEAHTYAGIKLDGDTDVPYAWYLTIYLQRIALSDYVENRKVFKDVNALISRQSRYHSDYADVWDMLRNNPERRIPGWHLIALSNGMLDSASAFGQSAVSQMTQWVNGLSQESREQLDATLLGVR